MPRNQGIEVVARFLRVQPARELHGAEHGPAEGELRTLQRIAQEAVIEAGVVGHEGDAVEALLDVFREPLDARLPLHHLVADAGEGLDGFGDGDAGVHQALPALGDLPVAHADDGDLGDAVAHRVAAGGFNVDESVVTTEHLAGPREGCVFVQR